LTGPYRVLSAQSAEEVPGLLNEIAAEQARGRWVAGYLAYEAGAAFGLTVRPSDGLPLAWMAVYPPAGVRRLSEAEWAELTGTVDVAAVAGLLADVTPRLSVTPDEYARAIGRVRELIAAGDTYQVNYTVRARFDLAIDPFDYFLALVRRQRVPYGAYLDLGPSQMLSLSPEQFLRRRGTSIESMPMKGTRPRGSDPDRDADVARELISSQKDRAENLMIVDMIRNDLGRVSRAGSVRVPALYAVEPYRTVWQMASTVTGRIRREATPADLLAAAFPGASITGAPKHHTMEIIAELETEPRGIYTGAVGLFLPARPPDQASSGRAPAVADDQDRGFVGGLSRSSGGEADPAVDGGGTPGGTGEAAAPVAAAGGDFTCSVAIRTLVHQQGHFRLGVGGGIVWDSRSGDEYQEALDKAAFALLPADGRWEPPTLVERARAAAIGLFETMLLLAQEEGGSPDPGDASHPGPPHPRGGDGRPGSPGPTGDRLPGPLARLPHLAAHLDRLAASAFALDLTFDRTLAETVLEDLAWSTTDAAVVRLDLGRGGQLRLSTRPVPEPHPGPITLLVSPFRTDPYDPLLAHKSTARRLYDRERERAQAIGCHEALFLNQLGLVTEGAVTNLFARFGRHWVTPPVSDGLLPGIWRTAFLARTVAEERSLTLETLLGADEIVVGNSVRGAMPVGAVWLNELDGLVSSAP
jgi:para-aminobenzoate synthetase/4-amino-4-deoxychorismate lyase